MRASGTTLARSSSANSSSATLGCLPDHTSASLSSASLSEREIVIGGLRRSSCTMVIALPFGHTHSVCGMILCGCVAADGLMLAGRFPACACAPRPRRDEPGRGLAARDWADPIQYPRYVFSAAHVANLGIIGQKVKAGGGGVNASPHIGRYGLWFRLRCVAVFDRLVFMPVGKKRVEHRHDEQREHRTDEDAGEDHQTHRET